MPTTKTDQLAQRVARGAAWLDRVHPDWYTRINPATLEMREGCNCILGQLATSTARAGYQTLLDVAALVGLNPVGWACHHGFTDNDRRWLALEEAWVAEMKARFEREVTV